MAEFVDAVCMNVEFAAKLLIVNAAVPPALEMVVMPSMYTPSPAEAEFDVLTAGLGTIQLFP